MSTVLDSPVDFAVPTKPRRPGVLSALEQGEAREALQRHLATQTTRKDIPPITQRLVNVLVRCLEDEPQTRSDMSSIVASLGEIQDGASLHPLTALVQSRASPIAEEAATHPARGGSDPQRGHGSGTAAADAPVETKAR